jgi:hypothetical protein
MQRLSETKKGAFATGGQQCWQGQQSDQKKTQKRMASLDRIGASSTVV